jgi:hypothetical protein
MMSNCSKNLTNIMMMEMYNLRNMGKNHSNPANQCLRMRMTLTLVVILAVIIPLIWKRNISQVRIKTKLEKKSKVLTLRWMTQW